MNPPNRVFNAHILYDPQRGHYWLDEHEDEKLIDTYSHVHFYATKSDACRAAVEWAKSEEYSVIVLRSEKLWPNLRLLSDDEITVKLAGKSGTSMKTGKILTIHLDDEQYDQLKYLVANGGDISHRSPNAYIITKLITEAYRRAVEEQRNNK